MSTGGPVSYEAAIALKDAGFPQDQSMFGDIAIDRVPGALGTTLWAGVPDQLAALSWLEEQGYRWISCYRIRKDGGPGVERDWLFAPRGNFSKDTRDKGDNLVSCDDPNSLILAICKQKRETGQEKHE